MGRGATARAGGRLAAGRSGPGGNLEMASARGKYRGLLATIDAPRRAELRQVLRLRTLGKGRATWATRSSRPPTGSTWRRGGILWAETTQPSPPGTGPAGRGAEADVFLGGAVDETAAPAATPATPEGSATESTVTPSRRWQTRLRRAALPDVAVKRIGELRQFVGNVVRGLFAGDLNGTALIQVAKPGVLPLRELAGAELDEVDGFGERVRGLQGGRSARGSRAPAGRSCRARPAGRAGGGSRRAARRPSSRRLGGRSARRATPGAG